MDLSAIQAALRERNIDAWLFYDHHHRDPIAYRVLGLPAGLMVTRRWFYLIPAQGEPVKAGPQDRGWASGHSARAQANVFRHGRNCSSSLKAMLAEYRDIAMQYSPNNLVFTISLVDGGTHRAGTRPGEERGQLRRPGGAIRSHLDRRADQDPFRRPRSQWTQLPPPLSGDRPASAQRRHAPNTKSSSGSWKLSSAKIW